MARRAAASEPATLARSVALIVPLLALATGAIHAWIGVDFLMAGLQQSALAFLGMATPYLVGVALYALGIGRRWIVRLAPLYVALLLLLWLFAGARDLLAYVDKIIELVLLVALAVFLYLDHRGDAPQLDGRQQPAA